MSKYKLIKAYPGSPELGTVVSKRSGSFQQHYTFGSGSTIYKGYVEKQPEFWEEIIEKDYEIVSFRIILTSTIITLDKQSKTYYRDLEYYSTTNNYEIYSVKHLSDGEVFTVGDKLAGYDIVSGNVSNISSFRIENNTIKVGVKEIGVVSLNNCKKYKAPLFTTQDGVEIFEHQLLYFVNTLYSNNEWKMDRIGSSSVTQRNLNTHLLLFTTKEAAEEYILMNKPCLSVKDVFSIVNTSYFNHRLKEFAKSKL